jgi:hypothetical protein
VYNRVGENGEKGTTYLRKKEIYFFNDKRKTGYKNLSHIPAFRIILLKSFQFLEFNQLRKFSITFEHADESHIISSF